MTRSCVHLALPYHRTTGLSASRRAYGIVCIYLFGAHLYNYAGLVCIDMFEGPTEHLRHDFMLYLFEAAILPSRRTSDHLHYALKTHRLSLLVANLYNDAGT